MHAWPTVVVGSTQYCDEAWLVAHAHCRKGSAATTSYARSLTSSPASSQPPCRQSVLRVGLTSAAAQRTPPRTAPFTRATSQRRPSLMSPPHHARGSQGLQKTVLIAAPLERCESRDPVAAARDPTAAPRRAGRSSVHCRATPARGLSDRPHLSRVWLGCSGPMRAGPARSA